ncbi:hypothetical protein EYF80_017338 [Liparis tanakae]|uniref:Uncharacterized protein n=1 Tax=Liparis tanakae TaxID=230148 RepID=A0A4Z2I568_9TELE|nr:hypothetical protein EYF80_017338 [Liparis tanakae]
MDSKYFPSMRAAQNVTNPPNKPTLQRRVKDNSHVGEHVVHIEMRIEVDEDPLVRTRRRYHPHASLRRGIGQGIAGRGRWHPVIQLLFPLACAGCAPLSSAHRAISSPKKPKDVEEENDPDSVLVVAFLLRQTMPGQEVILGCGRKKRQAEV